MPASSCSRITWRVRRLRPLAELKQRFLWKRNHFRLYADRLEVDIWEFNRFYQNQFELTELSQKVAVRSADGKGASTTLGALLLTAGVLDWWLQPVVWNWWLYLGPVLYLPWLVWEMLQGRTVLYLRGGNSGLFFIPNSPSAHQVTLFLQQVKQQRTVHAIEHYGLWDPVKPLADRLEVLLWLKENHFITQIEYTEYKRKLAPTRYASDAAIGFRASEE